MFHLNDQQPSCKTTTHVCQPTARHLAQIRETKSCRLQGYQLAPAGNRCVGPRVVWLFRHQRGAVACLSLLIYPAP